MIDTGTPPHSAYSSFTSLAFTPVTDMPAPSVYSIILSPDFVAQPKNCLPSGAVNEVLVIVGIVIVVPTGTD